MGDCSLCKEWDSEFSVRDLRTRVSVLACSGCLSNVIKAVLTKSSADNVLVFEV